MNGLAQIVAGRSKEAALRAVGGQGDVARLAHLLEHAVQLGALGGHARLELAVECCEIAACAHETVNQQPRHQRHEQQAGVGQKVDRRVVAVVMNDEPIVHRESKRSEPAKQQQHARRTPLAPSVLPKCRDRHQIGAVPNEWPDLAHLVEQIDAVRRIKQQRR